MPATYDEWAAYRSQALSRMSSSPSVSESPYIPPLAQSREVISLPKPPSKVERRYLRLIAIVICRHKLILSFVPRCRMATAPITRRILSDDQVIETDRTTTGSSSSLAVGEVEGCSCWGLLSTSNDVAHKNGLAREPVLARNWSC